MTGRVYRVGGLDRQPKKRILKNKYFSNVNSLHNIFEGSTLPTLPSHRCNNKRNNKKELKDFKVIIVMTSSLTTTLLIKLSNDDMIAEFHWKPEYKCFEYHWRCEKLYGDHTVIEAIKGKKNFKMFVKQELERWNCCRNQRYWRIDVGESITFDSLKLNPRLIL